VLPLPPRRPHYADALPRCWRAVMARIVVVAARRGLHRPRDLPSRAPGLEKGFCALALGRRVFHRLPFINGGCSSPAMAARSDRDAGQGPRAGPSQAGRKQVASRPFSARCCCCCCWMPSTARRPTRAADGTYSRGRNGGCGMHDARCKMLEKTQCSAVSCAATNGGSTWSS
jgi:hypothetical protein